MVLVILSVILVVLIGLHLKRVSLPGSRSTETNNILLTTSSVDISDMIYDLNTDSVEQSYLNPDIKLFSIGFD